MAEEKKGPPWLLIIGALLFGGAILQIVKTFLLSIIANLKDLVWSLTGEIKNGLLQGVMQLGIYTIILFLAILGIIYVFRALGRLF